MIARLTGTILDLSLLHIVLDVQGVGYLVAVQKPSNFTIGETVTLHTHLAIRENAHDLYGFLTRDELSMFELLLTIPKIGPKSAMQILTQADLDLLTSAIGKNDPVYLSKMSGISKKTSEKIVSELQSKFETFADYKVHEHAEGDNDIVDALIALGYNQKDAREALLKLSPNTVGTNERLKEALKLLGS